jgi:hypothetical protein
MTEQREKAAAEPPLDCRVMPGLTQCQNPLHFHKLGPLVIGWQIAHDYWALRDRSGNRVRRWLAIETVKALDGDEVILNFVVMRLSLSFGWQRGA